MTLRLGWLSPFNNRTGVGTFSKAVTDALPAEHGGERIDTTIIAPVVDGLYSTRHRFIDIAGAAADTEFYDLFDILFYNMGNNTEHHDALFQVLRNRPGVVVCHDYVYQHFLATLIHDRGQPFLDYVALSARYGSPATLRSVRQASLTRDSGLRFAPWDSDLSAAEPLAQPILRLGSALVVHSAFAESYARQHFNGPILRLGMPYDQRPARTGSAPARAAHRGGRRVVVSFGHVQSTKCIDEVLLAIAGSQRLRDDLLYVVSGFSGHTAYLTMLREMVAEHGLDDTVRFELNLTEAQLAALADEADAFVNLRYPNTEGASVSLIEQLVTGKPVVVFDTGCYAEVPDDAVIKVAMRRDLGAVQDALHRLLEPRAVLDAIGQRGRDHALRFDCAGYGAGLLDLVARERPALQRRASFKARWRIDTDRHVFDDTSPESDPWDEQLTQARDTFDAIDVGRLHVQPSLLRALNSEQLTEYIQAVLIREGLSETVNAALRQHVGGRDDPFLVFRTLQIVRQAAIDGDPYSLACLPDVVPHRDLTFWSVVAAFGPTALATTCHYAFFGDPPPGEVAVSANNPTEVLLLRLRLADGLARRDRANLKAAPEHLDAVVRWLREAGSSREINALEPVPLGRNIAIGSSEQRRFLRLFGFFKPERDHAWTSVGHGLVYLRPPDTARTITLSGYMLGTASVTIAAEMSHFSQLAEPLATPGGPPRFRIELPKDRSASVPGGLCLAIRASSFHSPAELGISDDIRPLGFCLQHVAVD